MSTKTIDAGDGAGTNGGGAGGTVLSPVVRRLITEHNLDPGTIKGTGAGGRITRADVLAVVEGGGSAAPGSSRSRRFQSRPVQDRTRTVSWAQRVTPGVAHHPSI